MKDLFEMEQKIYDDAMLHATEINNDRFSKLATAYGKLLKQLRRATKFSDRAMSALNTSKHDLLDKVHYDALTGIYNRRFLEDSLQRVIESQARASGMLSVMMLDIDYFKNYNDTYGHNEGDNCLSVAAQAIADNLLRPDDFVARYGGEEFVVILPGSDESGARVMANRIIKAIRALNIPHISSEVAEHITVSVGITTGAACKSHSGADYVKRSDEALYRSKQSGRNRYTFLHLEGGS
ncbi:MAG: GGDEF domain-containing protein [Defluviitaleaceae bacterium]|nr:GGDEF domain-containing protein [Defluviitaleaceae bacterium]MCL2239797.1 GGDEF domain-containing protein [Defluviitaleaceae bacterium]